MKARIWKDRDRGWWCFVVVDLVAGKGGARSKWEDALAEVLAAFDEQRAVEQHAVRM